MTDKPEPVRIDLTVVALDGEELNVTRYGGPPTVILGSWITVRATNGQTTVHEKVLISDAPVIGAPWHVYQSPKEPS
jgi:expansin (peptidoglycan-binding protein)